MILSIGIIFYPYVVDGHEDGDVSVDVVTNAHRLTLNCARQGSCLLLPLIPIQGMCENCQYQIELSV